MVLTQEEINRSRYALQAAPQDSWRIYDATNPIPGYFQFDWLSSRHPDLYHRFALSTVGLMEKLSTLVDLAGCDVVDICAGTGRSAIAAAGKARRVFAVDLYTSVVSYGEKQVRQGKISNVFYINGDREYLPLPANSMDVAINAWAELNPLEAYRVLKSNGYLVHLGAVPDALCGELTSELVTDYDWLPRECASPEVFAADCADTFLEADGSIWNGIPLTGPVYVHQFTYIADYGDFTELAAITGRLYGPKARHYFTTRKQSTFAWRLQVIMGQVGK